MSRRNFRARTCTYFRSRTAGLLRKSREALANGGAQLQRRSLGRVLGLVGWVELFVAWRADDGFKPYGAVGGFAVLDVLSECTEKAGYAFRVQSCGPNCQYPFSHQDLEVTSTASQNTVVEEIDTWTLRVVTSPAPGDAELVRRLGKRFAYVTRVFARLRSHGVVVWRSERTARKDLGELLALQVERAQIAARGVLRSIPGRWKHRRDRRKSSALIASLWLKLATLDQHKRQWDESRYLFDTSESSTGYGLLFRSEYADEVNSVSGLDVGNLREAVSQMTARADTWGVIFATGGGAVFGGVIGALIAGLFTVLARGVPNLNSVFKCPR